MTVEESSKAESLFQHAACRNFNIWLIFIIPTGWKVEAWGFNPRLTDYNATHPEGMLYVPPLQGGMIIHTRPRVETRGYNIRQLRCQGKVAA